MMYAARPAATPDADWTCPAEEPVSVHGIDMTQTWLAGLTSGDLAAFDLVRAEVVGAPPIPGLGDPPVIGEEAGQVAWLWSLEGVANLRALRVGEIKAEAGRRILDVLPLWKQSNLTKRAAELNDIRIDGPLSEDLEAERQALKVAVAWVDAIRAASNTIEANLPTDAVALAAFDATTADGWPSDLPPEV